MRLAICWMALLAAPIQAQVSVELDAFAGKWTRSRREADDRVRNREIARVTESLNFLARPIARPIMRHAMRPPESIEIRVAENLLTILPQGGETIELASTDTQERDAIVESWRHGDSSHGTTRWELNRSKDLLTMTQVVHSSSLDGAVTYATHYRRAAALQATQP